MITRSGGAARPSRRYPTFLNPVTVTATLIAWAVVGAIVWWLS